jgi:hypothetical protein
VTPTPSSRLFASNESRICRMKSSRATSVDGSVLPSACA